MDNENFILIDGKSLTFEEFAKLAEERNGIKMLEFRDIKSYFTDRYGIIKVSKEDEANCYYFEQLCDQIEVGKDRRIIQLEGSNDRIEIQTVEEDVADGIMEIFEYEFNKKLTVPQKINDFFNKKAAQERKVFDMIEVYESINQLLSGEYETNAEEFEPNC